MGEPSIEQMSDEVELGYINPRCGNCRFCGSSKGGMVALCRYNPPNTSLWPVVDPDKDWCGKFEPQ